MRVAVLGAGISGLSFAYELKKLNPGAEITIFEAGSAPGGLLQSESYKDFVLERGPDSLFTKDKAALELCKELKIESECVYPESSSFLMFNGKELEKVPDGIFKPFPESAAAIWKHRELSLFGKLRALIGGFMPVLSSKSDMPLSDFLSMRFGKEFSERVYAPLIGGVHSAKPEELSAAFISGPIWKERNRIPLKALSKLFKKKNSSPTPSYFSLSSGLGRLPKALAERLDVRFRFRSQVSSIRSLNSGAIEIELSDGSVEVFEQACCALPVRHLTKIFSAESEVLAKLFEEIDYSSTSMIHYVFPAGSCKLPANATGFIIPEREQRWISGVTFASQKWPGRRNDNYEQLRVFVKKRDGFDWTTLSDEQLSELCLDELEQLGFKLEPTKTIVDRWEKAQVIYKLGHPELLEAIERKIAEQFSGRLQLLGTLYSAGIPACIRRARTQAKKAAGLKLESPKVQRARA